MAEEGVAERVVLRDRAVLRELDVEGDRFRFALGDLLEQTRVQVRLNGQRVFSSLERHVVDLHDHDVERRRFIAAQREAEVDRLPLEVVEEAEVEDVRRRGRDDRAQRDEEEEPRAKAHLPRVHRLDVASVRAHS